MEPQEYQGPMGTYKVVNPIEFFDEEGNSNGNLEVGSIQEVPTELGDKWVADGDAEKVEAEADEAEAPAEVPVEGASDEVTE